MSADWGTRLLALARGDSPVGKGVTDVTTNNCNSGYVSETPTVTVVTPVTSQVMSFRQDAEMKCVTIGVTVPDEVAECAAVMEIDGGLPHDIAIAMAIFERVLPPEMMDMLAHIADEWRARSQSDKALPGLGPIHRNCCERFPQTKAAKRSSARSFPAPKDEI
jgi:hypothetical protein